MRRYQKGEFGNRAPTWNSVDEWITDPAGHGSTGWNGPRLFHLRNRVAGGETYYDLTVNSLIDQLGSLRSPIENFYVSEMAPTELTLIQGEVCRTFDGLYLTYSTVRRPMREALNQRLETASGLRAKILLESYMDANSFDWTMELLDNYDGHVVEFSTYSCEWGTLPYYNSVFWECRAY